MTAHPNLRARALRGKASAGSRSEQRARSAVPSRAGAMIARLGRKIAAYPILAIGVAFGSGYAFIRWIRR
jgi:hypothetical protein